jgi:predicted alpha/beta superfamily hydrolase
MVRVKLLNKKKITGCVCAAILVFVGLIVKSYIEEYTSDFIDHNIYSSVLGENRKIFVRLPDGYDSSMSYPLIIKSDGNFNLKRWDESISRLSELGEINDSILVAIPNLFWVDSRNRDLVPPYTRKDVQTEARPSDVKSPEIFGKADLFLAFIESELLPFLEKQYSINDNRLLSGFSAGGSFVLYTITTKPELFTGYFVFSPAAWYDNSVVVTEFNQDLKNVSDKPIFLYLSLGAAENEIITGSFKGLLSAIQSNGPENLKSEYSYSVGAGHVENPYISVPKALKAYYKFRAEKI